MTIHHPPSITRPAAGTTLTTAQDTSSWTLTTPQCHDLSVTTVAYGDAPAATPLALLVDRHIMMRDDLRYAAHRGIARALATTDSTPVPAA